MRCSLSAMLRRATSVVALLAASMSLGASAQAARAGAFDSPSQYCVNSGGNVEIRQAYFGTNNVNPLPLNNRAAFCRYTASDGSSIYILTSTLYAAQPTLAALAYYSKTKLNGGCTGNPASCYCSQLGGTDLFGGINAAGGGWVLKDAPDRVVDACVFPDLSSIDAWGLTYHSAGIVRGIDLAKVMRYRGAK